MSNLTLSDINSFIKIQRKFDGLYGTLTALSFKELPNGKIYFVWYSSCEREYCINYISNNGISHVPSDITSTLDDANTLLNSYFY